MKTASQITEITSGKVLGCISKMQLKMIKELIHDMSKDDEMHLDSLLDGYNNTKHLSLEDVVAFGAGDNTYNFEQVPYVEVIK